MKRTIFTLSILCIFAFGSFAQTVRRCNNDPNVPLGLNMYRTLQAAHDAAVANDIIYVEPSYNNVSYGGLICAKTLRIIGNGYFHTINTTITQPWEKKQSIVNNITIESGVGTLLQGLTLNGSSSITVKAQNVIIIRNYIGGTINLNRTSNPLENASGTSILQNYFSGTSSPVNISGTFTSTSSCDYTPLQVQNVIIKNNLNLPRISANTVITGTCPNPSTSIPGASNLLISNNTFYPGNYISTCQNCTVHSNVFPSSYSVGILDNCPGTVASHNVCGTNPCVFGTNNVDAANNALLFLVNPITSNTPDKDFQLSGSSQAIGAGLGGVDAGAFGTNNPYRLSGLAPVPQITTYSQNASSGIYTTATPMSITISVRGNN